MTTSSPVTITLPTGHGHVVRFEYSLSDSHGWQVRTAIDDEVVIRHCRSWRAVEGQYTSLLARIDRLRSS